jgi:hypothetical protein
MRLECQLVTNGIYYGDSSGYQDPRRSALESSAVDWQHRLRRRAAWVDVGDAGRVYFWARRQDIEASDFEGSWAILQCY